MSEQKDRIQVDAAAVMYLRALAAKEDAEAAVGRHRQALIELVQEHGQYPPRATKTLALSGNEYELRVTTPIEVTVDTRKALNVRFACMNSGAGGRLFRRLFKKIETFVLVQGADELINQPKLPERAPRNLRSLFARAVKIRELAPQLEVRKKEKEAA